MTQTKLSVNINKVALVRNSRGENLPNLTQFAKDCESFGAQGITIHPRPDQRHIRFDDIPALKSIIKTELNIEGYPSNHFVSLIESYLPHQVTLVPDPPNVLTSNEGWDIIVNAKQLKELCEYFKKLGVRSSIFINPDERMVVAAKEIGADRVELYTGGFAKQYEQGKLQQSIKSHILCNIKSAELNIGLNAGHDLNLSNLGYYRSYMTNLAEVSIGHALISDALYYGIHNTIEMYKSKLTYLAEREKR